MSAMVMDYIGILEFDYHHMSAMVMDYIGNIRI